MSMGPAFSATSRPGSNLAARILDTEERDG
jgi:hypothetical protein